MESSRALIRLFRTGDGSLTLHHSEVGEGYHSVHGAVNESSHVFIRSGLEQVEKQAVSVLEVGLGTGLNLLLTWIRCLEGKRRVHYTALEPFPVDAVLLEELGHCHELAWPGLHEPFMQAMRAPEGVGQQLCQGLSFTWISAAVQQLSDEGRYDVIYFDAFSPRHQPEMWSVDVFRRMFTALRPGGILVTYCAQGEVRRSMKAAGFLAERIAGPPGKKHMLRAVKPTGAGGGGAMDQDDPCFQCGYTSSYSIPNVRNERTG